MHQNSAHYTQVHQLYVISICEFFDFNKLQDIMIIALSVLNMYEGIVINIVDELVLRGVDGLWLLINTFEI